MTFFKRKGMNHLISSHLICNFLYAYRWWAGLRLLSDPSSDLESLVVFPSSSPLSHYFISTAFLFLLISTDPFYTFMFYSIEKWYCVWCALLHLSPTHNHEDGMRMMRNATTIFRSNRKAMQWYDAYHWHIHDEVQWSGKRRSIISRDKRMQYGGPALDGLEQNTCMKVIHS